MLASPAHSPERARAATEGCRSGGDSVREMETSVLVAHQCRYVRGLKQSSRWATRVHQSNRRRQTARGWRSSSSPPATFELAELMPVSSRERRTVHVGSV